MMNRHTRRRTTVGAVLVGAALALGAPTALAGTASAAPAAPAATPPGPVGAFAVDPARGEGARSVYSTAHWTPAAPNGGTGLRYAVQLRDDVGRVSASSTTDTSVTEFGDRCLAPFTVTVRAQTTDPATGRTLTGPPSSGSFGTRADCDINMSITARPGHDRGTIDVTLHQNPPVDPYVAGPCVLLVDGREAWHGTCGAAKPDQVVTVGAQPGRPVLVQLRTTTPRDTVLFSNPVVTNAS